MQLKQTMFIAALLGALSSPALSSAAEPLAPAMVAIPAGSFIMGDTHGNSPDEANARPAHAVKVKAFKLARYETTLAEFDAFSDATGRPRLQPAAEFSPGARDSFPAVRMGWQDAADYAAWLAAQTGRKFRLPSEAEWQYAARAGTTSDFYWGDAAATNHANVGDDWAKPSAHGKDLWLGYAPVGQFPPNPWGLHDMAGNVWEWVQDCYHPDFVGAPTDGSAWLTESCAMHTQVGNSFHNLATPVFERGARSDKGNATMGMRLAEDL